jgi:peptidoglycan/xylan/chitin deacetylase (PgdA/CDA1 family)
MVNNDRSCRLGLAVAAMALALGACDRGSSTNLDDDEGAGASAQSGGSVSSSVGGGGGSGGGNASVSGAAGTAGAAAMPSAACQRPAGMPAVSLTYDDSLDSDISNAAPALAKHQLKATFFVMDVRGDTAPWAALRAQGHELGSHTFKHPCPKVNTWVAPGDANEDYDLTRMTTELDDSITMLKSMGQTAPFTFAYPCGVDWVGEDHQSYVPLIQARFAAARGVVPGVVKPGAKLTNVPATFSTADAAALIAIADGAISGGGWVVFGFHGVGADHTPVTLEAHEALLAHLDDHRGEIYVGTFGELAACLAP